MGRTDDAATVLCAAVERHELFAELRHRPLSRGDIEEVLSVSRSTVHRVVSEFESMGVLTRADGEYRLSPYGRVVAAEVEQSLDAIESAERLEPFLAALDAVGEELEYDVFRAATVTSTTPGDPYRPLRRLVSAAQDATTIREFDPTTPEPSYQSVLYDRAGPDLSVSMLYPPSVVDYLAGNSEPGLDRALNTDTFEIRVGELPPFRLAIVDGHAYVGVYDDETTYLRALVDSDDDGTVAWAREHFEQRWATATPYEEYREHAADD